MALNINGTTGISGVNGSASAPALQGTDSNTGVSFGTDTVNINTGGSTKVTVDSSGNVGIGNDASFPVYTHINSRNFILGHGGESTALQIHSSSTTYGGIYFGDVADRTDANSYVGSIQYKHGDDYMDFRTNGSERMRITSAGNVGIGTTSPDRLLHVSKAGPDVARFTQHTNNQGSNHACISLLHAAATASAQGVGMVFVNASGTDVGSIRFGSSTSYNTSSDYRLKENVVAISDAITRLKTLKPSRFNFKIDKDTTVDGFLAHEVTAVPEAITGTKDEVDSDNNPIYQAIDQSKLVPLLTAALQEAIAKIEALETKVAALEAA